MFGISKDPDTAADGTLLPGAAAALTTALPKVCLWTTTTTSTSMRSSSFRALSDAALVPGPCPEVHVSLTSTCDALTELPAGGGHDATTGVLVMCTPNALGRLGSQERSVMAKVSPDVQQALRGVPTPLPRDAVVVVENVHLEGRLVHLLVAAALEDGFISPKDPEVGAYFLRKVHGLFSAAAAHKCTCLVLGAWGCGAAKFPAALVAETFRDVLQVSGAAFDKVIFAVPPSGVGHLFRQVCTVQKARGVVDAVSDDTTTS
jgi:hypothetical protein